MTDAPGERGRGPSEDAGGRAEAEPLFPSEGTFSAVVPLSQVRDVQASASDPAAADVAAPEEPEEEATLVPAPRAPSAGRGGTARSGGRQWLVTAAGVILSVTAGVAAGVYTVWTRQTRQTPPPVTRAADAAAQSQPAPQTMPTEAAPTEPAQAASPGAAGAPATSDEVVRAERAEKPEAEPRATRRARADAEPVEAAPAPKSGGAGAAARRLASHARPKPNTTAAAGRALPVSSPPPSAKSRTVIQWP
jgi:hypothetical protein